LKNFISPTILKVFIKITCRVLQSNGQNIAEICRQLSISEQTYYRRRKAYGGMRVDQAKRLKEIEQENSRLKKLVADLSLDNAILKETVRGNY
jgi:putative transposase